MLGCYFYPLMLLSHACAYTAFADGSRRSYHKTGSDRVAVVYSIAVEPHNEEGKGPCAESQSVLISGCR